jgi:hypothetical protein
MLLNVQNTYILIKGKRNFRSKVMLLSDGEIQEYYSDSKEKELDDRHHEGMRNIAQAQYDQDMKDVEAERQAIVEGLKKYKESCQFRYFNQPFVCMGHKATEEFEQKILSGGFAPKPICKACDGSGLSTYDCACHGGGGATVECSPCPVCKGTGVAPENKGGSQG